MVRILIRCLSTTLGHRPVIAIQSLIAEAAHPATLQYACTVLKKGCKESFVQFALLKRRTQLDCYTL
jgi:hypothetical protein